VASEQAFPLEAAGPFPTAAQLAATARRWSARMLCGLADQGLASVGNFALNILLVRSLSPSDYGAFALTFAVFLLAASLQCALILEPMGVIGPTCYAGRLPGYLGMTIWMHAGLSVLMTALLLLVTAGMAAMRSPLAPAMLGLSLSMPLILLFWLFRRACYLETRPELALKGSLLYVLLLVAGMAVLWRVHRITAAGGFLLMGVAGMAGSLLLWRCLRVRVGNVFSRDAGCGLAAVVHHHWTYARWSLGTTVLQWLASSIYLPLVGALAGLPAVAAFRATENLLHPMGQILTVISLLLLPWVTAQSRARDRGYLGRTAVKTSLLASLPTAVYVLGILAVGASLSRLIYGNDYYISSLSLLPWLGVSLVLRAVGDTGFGVAARAAGRPDIGFWATVAAVAVTLTAGLGLVFRYGAAGAAAGWMLSSAASCVASVCLFRGRLR
jgi:O-antigen/teichoic acid export membrane protein